ncbi:MAG TPA: PRTRC system protein C [Candidatus Prevotella stercoripullorum]|jgi:PRTRC genetic system protein C|uniref:PRTRC system protein C n=1 Tax=Marseilla massiliensis TaxID=1841864 RepID=A0A938WV60_9BACT|nr:PRTRC system protein C [Marseilla massiliensis]MBM6673759.1 PRTRC system protein C [Marseilla massiliensis]HIW43561.1 PRTRC system protein C [Candidatus Prevotella stercoripullorum]
MALEIKGLKRVFKLKKNGETLRLDDPNPEMAVNDVMDFYSMTYPELTTATPHGPVMEDDCAVYEFKTTIGTKG